jgi:Secretion system C-terminal sorting domain
MEYNPFTNEVLWDQAYDNHVGHYHYVNDIERTDSGDIVVVGSLYHSPGIYELCDSIFSFTFSYLSKFDASGGQEWQRKYTHDLNAFDYFGTEHILYDVEDMPNDGFLAVGDHWDPNFAPRSAPWVIRTDEWGCVEPGCQNISVSEFAEDNFATVFPNPSTGALNVHTAHTAQLQLFNSNGQLLHEQALLHSGQHQIALYNPLPAGVYVVHLSHVHGAQALKWVVVE